MRTNLLFTLSAALGAAAIAWTGAAFISTQPLGLAVTAVIGMAFALGLVELVLYRRETRALGVAIASAPDDVALPAWLGGLPPALQQPVQQRIQGERVGLPAPVITPYLVGLLVLLGLLGTFIGMVDTLRGAVLALQGSTELAAIREGLAAPIQGLSMAFGTSVAGIAASAMLGLNATLSRRERVLVTRVLDRRVAGPWQQHSLAYHRQQTYRALQEQAGTLPRLVERLDSTAAALEQSSERLASQLQQQQQQFLDSSAQQLRTLADAVQRSLQDSLAASGRAAMDALEPVAARTLAGLEAQALGVQQQLLSASESQLHNTAAQVTAMGSALEKQLSALSQQTLEQLSSLEATAAGHLAQLSQAMEAPLRGVIEAAAETPRTAAEVMGTLRDELSNALQRDTALLNERRQIMAELATLTGTLQAATEAQQGAVEELVQLSTERLGETCRRFDETLAAQAQRLTRITAEAAGSSAELASLGDAFGHGVALYSESNQALMTALERIEGALDGATQRSDEQMGYYVAQAREIIDQSMLSQREIIEELRRLGETGELLAAEAG